MNDSPNDEGNNDKSAPETLYDGENINAYSNIEVNIDEIALKPPTNYVNINANYDGEKNNY